MMRATLIVLALSAMLAHATARDNSTGTLHIADSKTSPGVLVLSEGEREILCYQYGDKLPADVDPAYRRNSYIHPLYSLDGEVLTADFPKDHPHHHGIFWAWPIVKTHGVKTDNWSPTTPSLRHHFVRFSEKRITAEQAQFTAENAWLLDEKTTVALEQVTVRVHKSTPTFRNIDVDLRIEAVGGPLQIAGAPELRKGYGGFSFRGALSFKGATLLTEAGIAAKDLVRTRTRWVDVSTDRYGITFLPGDDYPVYPPEWLARNSYAGYINISYPGLDPVTITPGKPLVLRQRMVVHRGKGTPTSAAAALATFTKSAD